METTETNILIFITYYKKTFQGVDPNDKFIKESTAVLRVDGTKTFNNFTNIKVLNLWQYNLQSNSIQKNVVKKRESFFPSKSC